MITIITINFNNAEGLIKTIKSVIKQSLNDFEFIIIDGGSNDGSIDIIKQFSNNINYWISEPDKGIYNAMNKGINHAHGQYLNFMNSGDCFYDDYVLEKVSSMPPKDIIMGNAITSDGKKFGPHLPITLYNLCMHGFNHQSLFLKRELCVKYMYDENLKFLSDFKLVIQCLIIDNCTCHYTDEYIAIYDLSGISSLQPRERNIEKIKVLNQLFTPRIARDYEYFIQLKSPLLEDIRYLSNTYKLHHFIIGLIRPFIFAHKFIKKIFNKIR